MAEAEQESYELGVAAPRLEKGREFRVYGELQRGLVRCQEERQWGATWMMRFEFVLSYTTGEPSNTNAAN